MIHWMIEIIVSSSLMILLLLVARVLLKGKISPKWQYALWGVILLRLAAPISFSEMSPVKIPAVSSQMISIVETQQVNIPVYVQPHTSDNSLHTESLPESPTQKNTDQTISTAKIPISISFNTVLLLIWIFGMLFTFSYVLILNIQFSRLIKKQKIETPEQVEECFSEIRELMKIKAKIKLVVCKAIPTPCLFGALYPKIILNTESLQNEKVLRHVFLHELNHFRQQDNRFALLRTLSCIIYWFNPLIWIGARICRIDAEQSCDARVIEKLDRDEQLSYGETLLKLVRTKPLPSAVLQTATTMSSGKRVLKHRIDLIINRPKKAVLWGGVAAMLAVITIVVSACSLQFDDDKSGKQISLSGATAGKEVVLTIPSEWTAIEKNSSGVIAAFLSQGKTVCEISTLAEGNLDKSIMEIANSLFEEEIKTAKKLNENAAYIKIFSDKKKKDILNICALIVNGEKGVLLKFINTVSENDVKIIAKSVSFVTRETQAITSSPSQSRPEINFTPDISFLDNPMYIYDRVTYEQAYSVFLKVASLTEIMDKIFEFSGFATKYASFTFSMDGKDGHYYAVREEYLTNKLIFIKSINSGNSTNTETYAIIDEKPLPSDCNAVNTHAIYITRRFPQYSIDTETIDKILNTGYTLPFLSDKLTTDGYEVQNDNFLIMTFYLPEAKAYVRVTEDYSQRQIFTGIFRIDNTDPPSEYWRFNRSAPLNKNASMKSYERLGWYL